jgi:cytochrome c553
MRSARTSCLLALAIATAIVAPSCSDPVHDQEVQALGPEKAGIPPSQYHRAGQPCTVCHGPEGPASTQFSMAGTIFYAPYSATSIGYGDQGAYISMVDANGQHSPPITTNCVGNWWTTSSTFNPAFPVLVEVFPTATSSTGIPMVTQISRATSCAECHADPSSYNAVGHIYAGGSPPATDPYPASCPVDPNLGAQP